jgi:hypothetical protein
MFKFELLENEKIQNIYRQTESVLFRPVLVVFGLIYFPWFILLKYEIAANHLRLLLFWTLLVLIYALRKFLLWLLNVYLLTNQRLVCVNYYGLFDKKVLESPLDKILNVSYHSKGLWQSLLGFGSVEVQAAGLKEPVILKNVAHPSQIKDALWQAHRHGGSQTSRVFTFRNNS